MLQRRELQLDIYLKYKVGDTICLLGFRQSETQTSLLSYRDWLKYYNFACNKAGYYTFQGAIAKALIRLRGYSGWSALLLFTHPEDKFSCVEAHIVLHVSYLF